MAPNQPEIPQPDAAAIAGDPGWHLHRWDRERGRALLVRVDEALLERASFLDQRIESEVSAGFWFPLDTVAAALRNVTPASGEPALMFHIGHCGSTLLSRVLSTPPKVLPVREPLPLRQLATDKQSGRQPMLTDLALAALGRRFRPGQRVLVKATSICHSIADELLAGDPRRRAVAVYQSLAAHLGNLFGKTSRTADLSGFADQRAGDWQRITGDSTLADTGDDGEQAVRGWLVAMHDLLAAREQHPEQMSMVDFERVLNDPISELAAAADWLGLPADHAGLAQRWAECSAVYSKSPDTPFSPSDRTARIERARRHQREQLEQLHQRALEYCQRYESLARCRRYVD